MSYAAERNSIQYIVKWVIVWSGTHKFCTPRFVMFGLRPVAHIFPQASPFFGNLFNLCFMTPLAEFLILSKTFLCVYLLALHLIYL